MADKKFKMPAKIGACADRLYQVKNDRLKLQKAVDELAAEESAIKEHIIQTLPKSEASGVAGKVARVSVTVKDVPQVKDWEAFHGFVKKTGFFHLLQKRLSSQAVDEVLESGKTIPGLEIFKLPTVSLSKV